jgi:glycosyltransferase involved in cell wall biosynthesis
VGRPPRVSVVLPVYNRAQLLERSAGSVLAQSFRDLELLIVDDGSTDATGAVAEGLRARDLRVRVLRQPNGGAAAARNRGIEMARGDLVAFQDSDDEWLPGHLAGHVAMLDDHPEAGVVYSYMTRRRGPTEKLIPDPTTPQREGDLSRALLRRNLVGTPTAVVRRQVLLEAGPMDPRLPQLEDWDLWIRVAQRASFAFRPESTVASSYSADSLSLDQGKYIDALETIVRKHGTAFAHAPELLAWHADRIGLHRLLAGRLPEGRDWSLRAFQADHRRWPALLRGSLPGPLARRIQRIALP